MMGDRPYVLRITSNGFEILIGGGGNRMDWEYLREDGGCSGGQEVRGHTG